MKQQLIWCEPAACLRDYRHADLDHLEDEITAWFTPVATSESPLLLVRPQESSSSSAVWKNQNLQKLTTYKNSPTAMPTVTKVSRKNTYRVGTIFMNPLRTQPPRSRAPHTMLFSATPMLSSQVKSICGLRRHFRLPDRRIDSRRKLPCLWRRSPDVDPGPGRRHD